MSAQLEGRALEVLRGQDVAHVAIPRPDGSVQTVIVWAGEEDGLVTLNSVVGRGWPTNLQRAGRATVTMMAGGVTSEWVSIEARLEAATTDGAREHVESLAAKYGRKFNPVSATEQRVKLTLRPERIFHYERGAFGRSRGS
jgi:hypothetical protein